MRTIASILLSFVIAAMFAASARAETSIATKWKPMGEAQDDCMAHAQMAIWRAGYDAQSPSSQSMSGKHGDYAAAIRCIAEQRIVVFLSSGPSSETTLRYLDIVYGHF
jgi:hypothetical protein